MYREDQIKAALELYHQCGSVTKTIDYWATHQEEPCMDGLTTKENQRNKEKNLNSFIRKSIL